MPIEPVVVTGIGIVSSIGIGAEAFFDSLLSAQSGIRWLSEWSDQETALGQSSSKDAIGIGAPIVDFQAKQFVRPRKALKVMCREIQTAFASAQLAFDHAGLADAIPASDQGLVRPDRLGVVYGSEIFFNPPEELSEPIRQCFGDDGEFHPGRFGGNARREVMPLWMLKYLPNMPACQIGISLNSLGPNNSLVMGDLSGPAALREASSYLHRDLAEMVLVGATGTRIGITRQVFRGDLPIPQSNDIDVSDSSRPHCSASTGVIGGEGAASLLLESQASAESRSANILAQVLAISSRFVPTQAMRRGPHQASTGGSDLRNASDAIAAAIEDALTQSGIPASQIGLVISHAAGDSGIDRGEAMAIDSRGLTCPVLAVSANIGHTGAASGMIGLVAGVLSLQAKMVPPTRGSDDQSTVAFCRHPKPLESPYVLCLSHNSVGNAMAVILGEAP